MVGRLLLEQRTQQALEFENRIKTIYKRGNFLQMIKWYIYWHHMLQHYKPAQKNSCKFHWTIIHRYHPQQDTLQAKRHYWTLIGQHLSHEPYQERFSMHTAGHSEHI